MFANTLVASLLLSLLLATTTGGSSSNSRSGASVTATEVLLVGAATSSDVSSEEAESPPLSTTIRRRTLRTKNSKASTYKFPLNLQCNPSEQNKYGPSGCHDEDCAADNFLDGCKACMCFNNGNPTWCDGTRNEYYDEYYNEHGENPWGDGIRENRKCNTFFGDGNFLCNSDWQCKRGSSCQTPIQSDLGGHGGPKNCFFL